MNPDLKKSVLPVLLAVLLTAGGTALIRANKVETTSVERIPMPVAAAIYREQASYTRQASYLGIVRAGSDSVVGFEVAGLLTEMRAAEGMRVLPGDTLAQLGTDRRQARLDERGVRELGVHRRRRHGVQPVRGRQKRLRRTSCP